MARYENILTLFDATEAQLEQVREVLRQRNTDFEGKEHTFYVETTSKVNTRDVKNDLTALGIVFLFFHNNISDGSDIRAGGLDEDYVIMVTISLLVKSRT